MKEGDEIIFKTQEGDLKYKVSESRGLYWLHRCKGRNKEVFDYLGIKNVKEYCSKFYVPDSGDWPESTSLKGLEKLVEDIHKRLEEINNPTKPVKIGAVRECVTEEVVKHIKRLPFQVGDTVTSNYERGAGTIIAIDTAAMVGNEDYSIYLVKFTNDGVSYLESTFSPATNEVKRGLYNWRSSSELTLVKRGDYILKPFKKEEVKDVIDTSNLTHVKCVKSKSNAYVEGCTYRVEDDFILTSEGFRITRLSRGLDHDDDSSNFEVMYTSDMKRVRNDDDLAAFLYGKTGLLENPQSEEGINVTRPILGIGIKDQISHLNKIRLETSNKRGLDEEVKVKDDADVINIFHGHNEITSPQKGEPKTLQDFITKWVNDEVIKDVLGDVKDNKPKERKREQLPLIVVKDKF